MAGKRRPTAPSKITRADVDRALGVTKKEVGAKPASKTPPKPLMSGSATKYGPRAVLKAGVDTAAALAKSLTRGQREIEQRLPSPRPSGSPVLRRRDRTTGEEIVISDPRAIRSTLGPVTSLKAKGRPASGQPAPRSTVLDEALPERAAHAPEGIVEEQLSGNQGHRRARLRFPMVLSVQKAYHDTLALFARRTGTSPAEPSLMPTRLDRALDHDESGVVALGASRNTSSICGPLRRAHRVTTAPKSPWPVG